MSLESSTCQEDNNMWWQNRGQLPSRRLVQKNSNQNSRFISWEQAQSRSHHQVGIWSEICSRSVQKWSTCNKFFVIFKKPSDLFGCGHFYPHSVPDLEAQILWGPRPRCQFNTACVQVRMLLCTDTIDVSPVQMDFSMIAQRTAKDNSSPNLISTKWWALFWLAWLTLRLYVGLLRSNVISWALSACMSVRELLRLRFCFILGLFGTPLWSLYHLYHAEDRVWTHARGCLKAHAQKSVI